MRLLKAQGQYFQSYELIEFDYADQGLTLISGRTKAGKSTILDLPCWVLYGTTAKDSNADDVRSWFAENNPTTGILDVEIAPGELIQVHRIRGTAKENDLYWIEAGSPPFRGKDLNDTQRLLNNRLGVSSDLYVLGSYLHYEGDIGRFFLAKPKDRREIFEMVANMNLPIRLSEAASLERKDVKKAMEAVEADLNKTEGKVEAAAATRLKLQMSHGEWELAQEKVIAELEKKAEHFDADKSEQMALLIEQLEEMDKIIIEPAMAMGMVDQAAAQIKALSQVRKEHKAFTDRYNKLDAEIRQLTKERSKHADKSQKTCPTCLGPADNSNRQKHVEELEGTIFDLEQQATLLHQQLEPLTQVLASADKLDLAYDKARQKQADNARLIDKYETTRMQALALRAAINTYGEQLASEKAKGNPFKEQLEAQTALWSELDDTFHALASNFRELGDRLSGLNQLYDMSYSLRGAFLHRAVAEISKMTNEYLEVYFDADLRVRFVLQDQDKLEIEINNGGYPCSYKQLSRGEKGMLKFAFSISTMRAAENAAGVKFSMISFDEVLDGLDASLKVKAYGLLQSLESKYESVFLIDHHEELKNLFVNKYHVENSGTFSTITKA